MPTPTQGESRDEFIDRCMGDPEALEDFPNNDQRFAFCNSEWERNKDMDGILKFKSLDLEVKDLDTVGRRVTVALSRFGNIDSDNDVISRGAFTKSIQERGPESETNRKIKFLRYHDFEQEIGKWVKLEETAEFLLGIGELGRSTKGNDAFLDYQDGIITEHSIGFFSIPERTEIREDGVRELKEVFLMEGSAVTFGANSETPTFEVSKGNKTEYLKKLNDQMDTIIKVLRNGEGTDDRFFRLEGQLHVLKSRYNSLINLAPSADTQENTPSPEESKSDSHNFYLNILK